MFTKPTRLKHFAFRLAVVLAASGLLTWLVLPWHSALAHSQSQQSVTPHSSSPEVIVENCIAAFNSPDVTQRQLAIDLLKQQGPKLLNAIEKRLGGSDLSPHAQLELSDIYKKFIVKDLPRTTLISLDLDRALPQAVLNNALTEAGITDKESIRNLNEEIEFRTREIITRYESARGVDKVKDLIDVKVTNHSLLSVLADIVVKVSESKSSTVNPAHFAQSGSFAILYRGAERPRSTIKAVTSADKPESFMLVTLFVEPKINRAHFGKLQIEFLDEAGNVLFTDENCDFERSDFKHFSSPINDFRIPLPEATKDIETVTLRGSFSVEYSGFFQENLYSAKELPPEFTISDRTYKVIYLKPDKDDFVLTLQDTQKFDNFKQLDEITGQIIHRIFLIDEKKRGWATVESGYDGKNNPATYTLRFTKPRGLRVVQEVTAPIQIKTVFPTVTGTQKLNFEFKNITLP